MGHVSHESGTETPLLEGVVTGLGREYCATTLGPGIDLFEDCGQKRERFLGATLGTGPAGNLRIAMVWLSLSDAKWPSIKIGICCNASGS